ncbi:MAG: DUF1013 domain-containing protein [Candidatus Pacebacteria bacterium]|nr:DUF1013 domain-containing protein [Candidatus Paceibacterota bacterium]
MPLPLMPKATAVWLVENTSLSFDQIAKFCGLHSLEVQAIADGEVGTALHGLDPVGNGQLTLAEIERCQADQNADLILMDSAVSTLPRKKMMRYTPISKRQDKPDAIAWLIKFYPTMTDGQIQKLIGTTKSTITQVRDRRHWNMSNIKPRHPVSLGLCSQLDLDRLITKLQLPLPELPEPMVAGTPIEELTADKVFLP